MELEIAGKKVAVNEEGFLLNPDDWNRDIAVELARSEGIENLTEKHWKVIDFIREQYKSGNQITIRKINKSGIVDIKEFYQLFPEKPLKKAAKIAGIPKPESCI